MQCSQPHNRGGRTYVSTVVRLDWSDSSRVDDADEALVRGPDHGRRDRRRDSHLRGLPSLPVRFARHRRDISIFNAIDATVSHAGRCYRTRDYDDSKARRYIPGITDEENALVDERYYHGRTSGQEGKEF